MIYKKQLEQIWFLNKELEIWVKKKCEIDYGLKSPLTDIVNVQTSKQNKAEEQMLQRIKIDEKIDSILDSIQKERIYVYETLEKINDSYLRMIIELRCVSLLPWNMVAKKIGFGNSESTKKTYYRAFEANGELKKKYLKSNMSQMSQRDVLL